MKTLRILFLLLFPFFAEVVISCCKCEPSQTSPYSHCSLEVNNLENSNAGLYVSQSNEIAKDNFGIQLVINRSEYTCSLPQQSFSFFSAAYACSCEPPFNYSPTNTINDISIYTKNDFDSTHLAGSDVTGYFNEAFSGNGEDLSDFVDRMDFNLYSGGSFESSGLNEEIIYLTLNTPPKQGTEHQFEIYISLSDGQSIMASTPLVSLI